MAALIIAIFREILLKCFDRNSANLIALCLLFLPLFQSQIEAINMELPSAFFILLSAYFLINQRISLAGWMTLVAMLIKGTGVLASAAFFVISFFAFFGFWGSSKGKTKWTMLFWGSFLLCLASFRVLLKYIIKDQHVSAGMVSLGVGWPSLSKSIIFYLYGISFIFIMLYSIKQKFFPNKSPHQSNDFMKNHFNVIWMMFIYGAMWFILFFNFYAVSPRYRLAVYPFLVFCVFYVINLIIKDSWIKKGLMLVIFVVISFSSYGLFYKPMLENDHVLLERSLEYRNDLELNQRLSKLIEHRYSNYRIGAPFIIAQMLAIPELGYVNKDLDVMIYGFECTYAKIKSFPGIKNLDIRKTIYVGVKVAQLNENLSYPIHPHDRVLEEIQYGNKRVWIFMGGVAIDSVLRAMRMMKLKEVWKGKEAP